MSFCIDVLQSALSVYFMESQRILSSQVAGLKKHPYLSLWNHCNNQYQINHPPTLSTLLRILMLATPTTRNIQQPIKIIILWKQNFWFGYHCQNTIHIKQTQSRLQILFEAASLLNAISEIESYVKWVNFSLIPPMAILCHDKIENQIIVVG